MTAVVFCKEMKEQLRGGSGGNGKTTSQTDGELSKTLVEWDTDICAELSNKIRIGNSGILDLSSHAQSS